MLVMLALCDLRLIAAAQAEEWHADSSNDGDEIET
jgi:hypothetical protein